MTGTMQYVLPGLRKPDRRIGGLLLDLDGTIYRGEDVIDGAPELIQALLDGGIPFKYVTNNSSASPAVVAERLAAMGIPAEADEVCTSAQAAAAYAAEHFPGGKVFMVGEDGLAEELEMAGLQLVQQSADVVVQGINRHFTYDQAAAAVRELLGGAAYVMTNPDLLLPSKGGLFPGAGSIGAMLKAASGVEPVLIGKPSTILMDYALGRLGVPREAVWVVGDNLATDIASGDNSGCRTILVLTGLTDESNYERYASIAKVSPYASCSSLDELRRYIFGAY
ncbi:HAD-IIA family hydrolase [Paenibacillus pasadenensis]|uniref:HAD-IIA family hydrolase n=1 Tax=Paenibacillus pasadenensis TaxID=217090 RepID=UPI0020411089|nr:HAD-IIA family hydrolase [Paenibacillus pasadenensis]MCM3748949.1 HAD-IIA family hydrolase [Paenibacillus pasadenensis]